MNLQIDGTLPRRGTAVEFTVRFNPNGPMPVPKTATLVSMSFVWVWQGCVKGAQDCNGVQDVSLTYSRLCAPLVELIRLSLTRR